MMLLRLRDQVIRRRLGSLFSRALKILLTVALGVSLCCPEARSDGEQQLSPEERRVVYLAQQSIKAKKFAEAQSELLSFMERRGDDVHYLVPYTLGNALALGGRNKEALTYYRKAAERNPEDDGVWLNMGAVCYDLGRFAEAGRFMSKAYGLMKEKEPELLYQAAVCFIKGKQPKQALARLKRICDAGGGAVKSEWIEAQVDVYMQLGRNREALSTLQRLLGRKGNKPRLWKLLAHVHMKEKEYGNAAAAFKTYLDLSESNREDVTRLGDLYRLAGLPLLAAREYERALQWYADEDDYKKIASAYLAAHRPDKAAHALTLGIEKQPSAGLCRMLGSIQYNEGKYREAFEAFRQSLNIDPGDGGAALLMGYCALQLNNTREAVKAFESAACFSQQRSAAQKALAQIDGLTRWEAK